MTCEKLNAPRRLVTVFLFCIVTLNLLAQKLPGQTEVPNTPVGSNCNGYLLYKPEEYNSTSIRYPLIINILGFGTHGDGSQSKLEDLYGIGGGNPHEQAFQGTWKTDTFRVNGVGYKFIVITPQFIQNLLTHIPTPSEINDVVNHAVQTYRIDTSRIYMIGSSQGAGAVWDYVGASSQYARRIAAVVPFAGVSFPTQEKANIMKYGKVAVWGFHNLNDESVPSSFTSDYVDFYNNAPTPFGITARKTLFNASGHFNWFAPMRSEYKEAGEDIYHWMLKYQNEPSKANAGNDQEIVLPDNSVTLTATGTAPNGTASSYSWQKFFGPTTGGSITSPGSASTTVTNLSQGTYIFQVTITGTDASSASDYVAITVNPTQQRIEDNQLTASSGVILNDPTTESSNGNTTRINGIDFSDWIEYNVTVPTTGVYRMRFRAGTFYGGTRFKVQRNNSGTFTDLATVQMYATDWDAYMNFYADVSLHAGTQTIRLQNFPPSGLENRVWFLNWFEVIDNTPSLYPLPVNFALFNANCNSNKVNLTWKTAGESNSSKFVVEKSSDGRNWTAIANIPAAGQSSSERSYNYTDQSSGSNNFYRITQEDFDGKKTQTSILRSNCGSTQIFSVFPNPVKDKAVLSISSAQSTALNLSIIDSRGAIVRTLRTNILQGNNQVSVNVSALPKGIYTLRGQWGDVHSTTKFIKD